MQHRLVNDTLVTEDGGIVAYCTCGWNSGRRFSSMIASTIFRDHRDNAKAEVIVPDADYRLGPYESAAYVSTRSNTRAILDHAGPDIDRVKLFSAIVSAVTREMREQFGSDAAAQILRGLAETMGEVERFDL